MKKLLLIGSVFITCALAGCDSMATMTASPANSSAVTANATLTQPAAGVNAISLPVASLPQELQDASNLQLIVGSTPINAARATVGGTPMVTFLVPSAMTFTIDSSKNARFLLVGNGTLVRSAVFTLS